MSILLRGATVFDGTGADPRPSTALRIEGERIDSLGAAARADTILDLEGCTLLPGLIDAHTHLGIAYDFAHGARAGMVPAAEIAAGIFENCGLALDSGFTTCRDMAGLDGGIVQAIAKRMVRGPRILPSAAAIAQDGGHGTFMAPWSDCHCAVSIPGLIDAVTVCTGADEVRLAARRAFRRGATQLKLFLSGGVISLTDQLSDTQLALDEIRAAVAEAEARGSYVAAHAHNNGAIRNGLAAGVRCFEHGTFLDEETARAMAQAGALFVPTLAIAHVLATSPHTLGVPPSIASRVGQASARMAVAIRHARKAGVLVGSGSDLLGPKQTGRGMEIVLRAEIEGASAALVSATATNAKLLGLEREIGTLQPGKLADVIAVRGDPLAEPGLFADPRRVVLVLRSGVIEKNLL
jgi:imidazolonepropionase-like amidohydrolase